MLQLYLKFATNANNNRYTLLFFNASNLNTVNSIPTFISMSSP